jgi:hypothetical protein
MESYVDPYMESSVVSGIRCYLEVYIRAPYQHSSYLFSCLCILYSQYTEFHHERRLRPAYTVRWLLTSDTPEPPSRGQIRYLRWNTEQLAITST